MSEGIDLDSEVRRVDPDRWLASRFIADPLARADVVALYGFDYELARASAVASAPLMAHIRLTWWRDGVDEIFAGGHVRRHPTLEALAAAVRGRDLPRDLLQATIETRLDAVEKTRFEPGEALAWARGAQGGVARLAAHVLGGPAEANLAAPAGVAWGLAALRRAGAAGGDTFDAELRAKLAGSA